MLLYFTHDYHNKSNYSVLMLFYATYYTTFKCQMVKTRNKNFPQEDKTNSKGGLRKEKKQD